MKVVVAATTAALILSASLVFAQTSGTNSPSTTSPGTTSPSTTGPSSGSATTSDKDTPPLKGANSFTEGEARKRAEARGFSEVKDLKKDNDGIWRGHAMQQGKPVEIAIDYKGNVVAPAAQQ